MKLIDMHCDTILNMVNNDKFDFNKNSCGVNLDGLKKSNSMAQFFACFVDLNYTKDPLQSALNMIDSIYLQIEKNKSKINIAKNYDEIIQNDKNNKISAILTIEEGEVLRGQLSNLRILYKLGIRLITLTWNYENQIGYPGCNKKYNDKGLKEFGFEVIDEMNKLGMIVDTSHLNDAGFYDALKHSKKPIVASHSNSREIQYHTRNLTDDMIKSLSEHGGFMGLNFCDEFLNSNHKIGTVEDMINHIKHIVNIGGIEVIGIGTDFDGISRAPEIKNIGEMYKLVDALKKSGFSYDDIEKIFYKNALRVIKDNLN